MESTTTTTTRTSTMTTTMTNVSSQRTIIRKSKTKQQYYDYRRRSMLLFRYCRSRHRGYRGYRGRGNCYYYETFILILVAWINFKFVSLQLPTMILTIPTTASSTILSSNDVSNPTTRQNIQSHYSSSLSLFPFSSSTKQNTKHNSTIKLSIGMVVVRCREPTLWLQEIPSAIRTINNNYNNNNNDNSTSSTTLPLSLLWKIGSVHVTIYEKCGLTWNTTTTTKTTTTNTNTTNDSIQNEENVQVTYTSQSLPNLGNEEASGYLHYIINHYYDNDDDNSKNNNDYYKNDSSSTNTSSSSLPDIVFFLQPDVFHGNNNGTFHNNDNNNINNNINTKNGNPHRNYLGHADLWNVTQLFQMTHQYFQTGYLALGRYRQRPIEWKLLSTTTSLSLQQQHYHPNQQQQHDNNIWKLQESIHYPSDPYLYHDNDDNNNDDPGNPDNDPDNDSTTTSDKLKTTTTSTSTNKQNLLLEIIHLLMTTPQDHQEETTSTTTTRNNNSNERFLQAQFQQQYQSSLQNIWNDETSILDFIPGACMVVSKERIRLQPIQVYQQLYTNINQYYNDYYNTNHRRILKRNKKKKKQPNHNVQIQMQVQIQQYARKYACALERTWHILFGSPPIHISEEIYPNPYMKL